MRWDFVSKRHTHSRHLFGDLTLFFSQTRCVFRMFKPKLQAPLHYPLLINIVYSNAPSSHQQSLAAPSSMVPLSKNIVLIAHPAQSMYVSFSFFVCLFY